MASMVSSRVAQKKSQVLHMLMYLLKHGSHCYFYLLHFPEDQSCKLAGYNELKSVRSHHMQGPTVQSIHSGNIPTNHYSQISSRVLKAINLFPEIEKHSVSNHKSNSKSLRHCSWFKKQAVLIFFKLKVVKIISCLFFNFWFQF